MKKYLFFLAMSVALPVFAQQVSPSALPVENAQDNCEILIEQAEQNQDKDIYAQCGFDDKVRAFEYWGPYVSSKNYRKALFELAMRHPDHDYATLYIQRSADNGYGPALMQVGHFAFEEGREEQAVSLYKQALQTGILSPDEQAQIAEKMGLIYLNTMLNEDDFTQAMAFIKQAAEKGQALSNNILGYYSYTGEHGFPQNDRVALNYFWRAILLDCPAAQENVGVFHLARLKRVDRPTAIGYMQDRLTSCTPPVYNEPSELEKQERAAFISARSACDCETVMETANRLKKMPYLLLEVTGDFAKMADSMGREHTAQPGQTMVDGTQVLEVRPTAAIISKGGKRFVLNLYPQKCADLCSKPLPANDDSVQIKPYRLTFTEQECLDLMAYARELVDVEKPFVGKEECMSLENKKKDTAEIFSLLNQVEKADKKPMKNLVQEAAQEEKAAAAAAAVGLPSFSKSSMTIEEALQRRAVKKQAIEKELNLNRQKRAKRKIEPAPQRLNPLNK